mgnify:CR=1 FL=1
MPRNKQYLAVKLLKTIGVNVDNRKFEQASARYLEHKYSIYEIREILKTYSRKAPALSKKMQAQKSATPKKKNRKSGQKKKNGKI